MTTSKKAKGYTGRVALYWNPRRGDYKKVAAVYGLQTKIVDDPYDMSRDPHVLFIGPALKVYELALNYSRNAVHAAGYIEDTTWRIEGKRLL